MMFDALSDPTRSRSSAATLHDDRLRSFILSNASGLRHAAHLLGGGSGLRLADRVIADALESGAVTAARRTRLDRLRALLTLENVHVEGSVEAIRFARIEPSDPSVFELCRLADGLEAALDGHPRAAITRPTLAKRAAAA